MLAPVRSPLGAPGAFALPDARPPALHPQRMDVCAFVGVAPRGPARMPLVDGDWPAGYRQVTDPERPLRRSVPVLVRSFDEFERAFGGFEGPGLLAPSVASYFEQGGRLAWIVRVVHARGAPFLDGRAQGTVEGAFTAPVAFTARSEGRWGDALRVTISFTTTTLAFTLAAGQVQVDLRAPVAVGTTLRFTDAAGAQTLALVTGMARARDAERARERWQLAFGAAPVAPARAELVEARIDIDDGAGRAESFDHLALAADHPESLANVLCDRAGLVWPDAAWAASTLVPASPRVEFLRATSAPFSGGADAWESIVPGDFLDPGWSAADELPGDGICALAQTASATQLVVPDLYLPSQWAGADAVQDPPTGGAGAEFGPCVDVAVAAPAADVAPSALTGLILDPLTEAGMDAIAVLQQSVIDFCEATQSLIALIDVPPDMAESRIEQWRANFDSAWAAAYHPWLIPTRRNGDGEDVASNRRRRLPPSAVAAGIVARRERERGIAFGPANEVAREVIHFAEAQPAGRADALAPLSINCYARQCDGIALLAARTLARDSDWRQLSVRRLVLMVRRALLAQTQWAVFEPNGPALWRDLAHAIRSLLRGLYRAGAFAGATEAESFFVRVLADVSRQDDGQIVIEVGVAPAEPLEFILVRLSRDGDGTLRLDE
jgi:hypothetical protein